ncbi:MAG TPA: sel1 repeat family protein [Aliiroseovarius sp.]|nr:sel1 repeat family protein [Aliiroseovarius sp.]
MRISSALRTLCYWPKKALTPLGFALALLLSVAVPVSAQQAENAVDAGMQAAGMFEAGAGVSGDDMMSILEGAAAAGQPLALWRLGEMYESGIGVEQDRARAFAYFSQIANENADTPPRSIEADIVARSFVKVGDYYKVGLPDAGIEANQAQSRALLFHAASYFGDSDAQYRVGLLYLEEGQPGKNTLQSARWLSLAAHKGHSGAQAVLGDLLFNGDGIDPAPVEGLMWLTLARNATVGTDDAVWISELLNRAVAIATPEQRLQALEAANMVRGQFSGN